MGTVATADPEGPVYAAQGTTKIEVGEALRWQALAKELRRQRDERDEQLADVRALLERALFEMVKVTKDRDEWKAKTEAAERRVRDLGPAGP